MRNDNDGLANEFHDSDLLHSVLGVVDLKNGYAVHAIAGERAKYRPVDCLFTRDGNAIGLAEGYIRNGVGALYVADLDAIEGIGSNASVVDQLAAIYSEVWLDAGLPHARVDHRPSVRYVIGTESLSGLRDIEKLSARLDLSKVVLSIDLRHQVVQFADDQTSTRNVLDVADAALECGIRQVLVLDLATVGTAAGPSTMAVCNQIAARSVEIEIASGGGIRDVRDLRMLKNAGCRRFLIGTALHNGRKNFGFETGSC